MTSVESVLRNAVVFVYVNKPAAGHNVLLLTGTFLSLVGCGPYKKLLSSMPMPPSSTLLEVDLNFCTKFSV